MPLIRLIDSINEAVGRVVSVVAVLFAGIIIYDVVMRYVFGQPTRWSSTAEPSYKSSLGMVAAHPSCPAS